MIETSIVRLYALYFTGLYRTQDIMIKVVGTGPFPAVGAHRVHTRLYCIMYIMDLSEAHYYIFL